MLFVDESDGKGDEIEGAITERMYIEIAHHLNQVLVFRKRTEHEITFFEV